MNYRIKYILYTLIVFFFLGCNGSEDKDLLPAQERKDTAISELTDKLTAPINGWRINYQPTPGSGTFFMLLKFDKQGNVNIKSDVVENDGEFINHTITYRIDNNLGLELIFDTYGVFHFLFEKDQASFGAEFEYIFLEDDGGDLIFESKTDFTDKTVVVFEEASASDESLLSKEIIENLSEFEGVTPVIFGGSPPIQQVIFDDKDISLFWSIDLSKRIIDVDMAGRGTTIEEINNNSDNVFINHTSGYKFSAGKLVLAESFSFSLNGETFTISELTLDDFSLTGSPLCTSNPVNTPVYNGNITGIGSVTMLKSLFDSEGLEFQPMTSTVYSVNVLFIFDDNANSLYQGDGIILDRFPLATGFVFHYGLEDENQPANAVGFFVDDINGNSQTFLRGFDATTTEGNKININLNNEFYYSGDHTATDEQNLIEITDQIFEGGNVYAYDLPVSGAKVFRLFNPCNKYEIFLVQ